MTSMRLSWSLPAVLILLLIGLAFHPNRAQAQSPIDAAHCAAMKGASNLSAGGLPVVITSAQVTQIAVDLPEVCDLEGYLPPGVGFQIALPMQGWNGKYFQTGCGGACGSSRLYFCDEPLNRHYACLGSDMGHRGTTADWDWADENLQGKVDFAFRSTHLAALVGKVLTTAFYGATPSHAYFIGCSTGGRQGLVEAQSFPSDFDGIIAGAPPLNETGAGLQLTWSIRANTRPDGSLILTEADARLIHQAVLDACDLNDGIKDGLIGDPRACKFDVRRLDCGKAVAGRCLTPEKLLAAMRLYSGPVDSKGRAIGRTGGVLVGSELNWIGDYVAAPGAAPQYAKFQESFMRYMSFNPALGLNWKLSDYNFDVDPDRMAESERLYSAANPDLRNFKALGGKLISYQGWADTSVVPLGTIDYYETVTRTMGGPQNTLDFYRLFTTPGGRHCSNMGQGADAVNYVAALENWVEHGQAPQMLVGQKFDWTGLKLRALPYPLDPKRVQFTRPVYLYPEVSHYKGAGDTNSPASYTPVTMHP
jgi:hypothetical protein